MRSSTVARDLSLHIAPQQSSKFADQLSGTRQLTVTLSLKESHLARFMNDPKGKAEPQGDTAWGQQGAALPSTPAGASVDSRMATPWLPM